MIDIDIKLPSRWADITDSQAAMIISILTICQGLTQDEALLICALRLTGIKILKAAKDGALLIIPKRHITSGPRSDIISEIPYSRLTMLISSMRWALDMPTIPWRPSRIMGKKPAEPHLRDFTFGQYIRADTLFRGYQNKKDPLMLRELARILVPGSSGRLKKWEEQAIIIWFASVNIHLAARYPDLYTTSRSGNTVSMRPPSIQSQVDAQLRALTKGDPLKEEAVLQLPLHRALTELNAQAAEYARIKATLKHNP